MDYFDFQEIEADAELRDKDARDQRFNAAVKRIEAEHQHIHDAARASQRGTTCLRCSSLQAELARLRSSLVTICNLVGGQASPDVSSEFLTHVPAEAEAYITRLREDKADLLSELEGLVHCITRITPPPYGHDCRWCGVCVKTAESRAIAAIDKARGK